MSDSPVPAVALPDALDSFEEIARAIGRDLPAVFLDYDGTLAPIVDRPAEAFLDPGIRTSLEALSRVAPVAIVSGRDVDTVRDFVRLADIAYAGSHGFDIVDFSGERFGNEEADGAVPALDVAERTLADELGDLSGVYIERKRYSVAVHYRLVDPSAHRRVMELTERIVESEGTLRTKPGKMVIEIQPDIPWDKGRAVLNLMERLGIPGMRIYIGDDVTDEDAFRAISEDGIGILVGEGYGETAARFHLADPLSVGTFLDRLRERVEERAA